MDGSAFKTIKKLFDVIEPRRLSWNALTHRSKWFLSWAVTVSSPGPMALADIIAHYDLIGTWHSLPLNVQRVHWHLYFIWDISIPTNWRKTKHLLWKHQVGPLPLISLFRTSESERWFPAEAVPSTNRILNCHPRAAPHTVVADATLVLDFPVPVELYIYVAQMYTGGEIAVRQCLKVSRLQSTTLCISRISLLVVKDPWVTSLMDLLSFGRKFEYL